MPIDASVTKITVTGNYVDFKGNAIAGQIKFTLSEMLRNSLADEMVVPSTISVTLDANGSFSVSLPSTNDPDMIPDFSYTVEEAFPKGRTYTILLPYDTAGSLNLADISPDPTLSETYVGLVDAGVWNSLENDIDTLDGSINQGANQFLKSGEYWYIPAAYSSYTELNAAFATYSLLNAGPYPVNELDLAEEIAAADAAASSAAASASTVVTLTAGRLNALLLIGG
jgi:hypothetical protein